MNWRSPIQAPSVLTPPCRAMSQPFIKLAVVSISCAIPSVACGQSVLVHLQGEEGSREAYFANFGVVLDRTPPERLLGPTTVRQLDTVVVYESAQKPEFSALRLQFECVVRYPYDGKTIPRQPAFDAPVSVRVGEGSWTLRREDLKNAALPAGPWRSASSSALLKLHKIACHDDVMRGAMVKAAKSNNNMGVFRDEVRKIGLADDLQLVSQESAAEYLDFSWAVLWSGARRPDPSGKWARRPSREELEAAKVQMAQIQQQVDQAAGVIKPRLEQGIQQSEAQLGFGKLAAEIRKNRSMSRNERLMLTVWEGKTEGDVAVALGAPLVSRAGRLTFLSFGQEFDNRVVVGNNKGAAWVEGLHASCNVQFVLHPDPRGTARVVDVRIWTQSNQGWGGGGGFTCDGLLETPR